MTITFRLAALAALAAGLATSQTRLSELTPEAVYKISSGTWESTTFIVGTYEPRTFTYYNTTDPHKWDSKFSISQPASLVISKYGKPSVTIMPNGDIIVGEGVTPTQAAKEFAKALKELWPSMFTCGSGK